MLCKKDIEVICTWMRGTLNLFAFFVFDVVKLQTERERENETACMLTSCKCWHTSSSNTHVFLYSNPESHASRTRLSADTSFLLWKHVTFLSKLQVRFKLASSYSGRVLKHVYEDGQELDSPEEKYPHSFVHRKIPPSHLEMEQLCGFEDAHMDQQGELFNYCVA